MKNAITVNGLGKAYKQYASRRSRLAEWFIPFTKPRHQLKWVLSDINFTVMPGEAIGLIGVNGAGKSTLLKMITGTVQPTTGVVSTNGRVAALLELGIGFHPDFTGRQNVFMAGQLLGHSMEEIANSMHEIESFAEIGNYIDLPVRTYSSGMQVRLAFSVATAIRPSILIVDEALAVGDIAFQRKCFARIEQYREKGTTLLFVSHDLETIKKLCDKAILLNQGKIDCFDLPKIVCERYERILFGGQKIKHLPPEENRNRQDPSLEKGPAESYGDGAAIIYDFRFEDANRNKVNVFAGGEEIIWRFFVEFKKDVIDPIFSMMLKTREGVCVYYIDSRILKIKHGSFAKGETFEFEMCLQNNLAPGTYFLNTAVRTERDNSQTVHHRLVDVAAVAITPRLDGIYPGGLADLDALFAMKRKD
ncbi:ABC transporter ATP-binding protein [Metapseudomonas otitidis]|uniref:ABC transporter ATP-binding protein n=1 Tax=Metapseudomonas otitidis TaxID=319939 RepID=UPI00280C0D1E|nr:ABC transporter ATP-binding protein [Pseudomonas otitidis]